MATLVKYVGKKGKIKKEKLNLQEDQITKEEEKNKK